MKSRAAGISEFQALLDWRNAPSEDMDTSPAQGLLGRPCTTLLPTTETLLTPRFSLVNDANKVRARKELQRKCYNRGKRTLSTVNPGETIGVRSPDGTWKRAECLGEVAHRSYEVLNDGEVPCGNRKDTWRTCEPQTARHFDECESVAQPDAVIPAPLTSPPTSPTEFEPCC